MLNEEIIKYLVINNFSIGISIDGKKSIHDKNRVFVNQKGTFDIIMNNIKKIEEMGGNYSTLSVITYPSQYEDLLELSEKFGLKNLEQII